jgi:hypothetical protein
MAIMDQRTPVPNSMPIYVPFVAFLRLIDRFKAEGIPPTIALSNIGTPEGTGYRYMNGLRWLGMVDSDGNPTTALRDLVFHRKTATWKQTLAAMVRRSYSFLAPAYADQAAGGLHDAFRQHVRREDKSIRKAETFFLSAANEAGLKIHISLLHRVNTAVAKRGAKAATPRRHADRPEDPKIPDRADELVRKLPELPAYDANWPDDVKRAWFETYGRIVGGLGKDR